MDLASLAAFAAFSRKIKACSMAAWAVYLKLSLNNDQIIYGLLNGVPSPIGGYNFRIPMGAEGPFTHLSVSVPPDAMGNRGPSRGDSSEPMCIETALVGPNGNLVHFSGLGYDDICRFVGRESYRDAIPELEAEILRLLPYAQGKKEIPEEYSGSETEEEVEEAEPMDVDP